MVFKFQGKIFGQISSKFFINLAGRVNKVTEVTENTQNSSAFFKLLVIIFLHKILERIWRFT